ncbi:hypothetical protein BC777_3330 [Yoonia maricola]|uniref:Uncharacterized protein n=1 Tax=Yoonia maricola TaxID=420999 RepID=A0A2M8W354_9RHOB|nr:hypothetical protein [Yoonia maricola]PJI85329.1 hypothetical protein BC777_3330 [Yoonia maricola]
MGRDWIIDVLADLRSFARDNDLPLLSAQLEEAGLVAEVEIASHSDASVSQKRGEQDSVLGIPTKLGMIRRT